MRRLVLSLLAITSALALANFSHASLNSVTVGPNPFFPSTGGTGNVLTITPDVVIEKNFTALGDIPIIIDARSNTTTGIDTYKFTERIQNNTGTDWTDFHLEFENIDSNQLEVDFLNATSPTNAFNFMTMTGALWLFGNVPTGSVFTLEFDLQVTDPVPGAGQLFGIHERPSIGDVPEPASIIAWMLLGVCLSGTVCWRRSAS